MWKQLKPSSRTQLDFWTSFCLRSSSTNNIYDNTYMAANKIYPLASSLNCSLFLSFCVYTYVCIWIDMKMPIVEPLIY